MIRHVFGIAYGLFVEYDILVLVHQRNPLILYEGTS